MSNSVPALLSAREAADRLGISLRQIIRLVDAGKIAPAHKMPGRTGAYLFEELYVEQLLEDQAAKAS